MALHFTSSSFPRQCFPTKSALDGINSFFPPFELGGSFAWRGHIVSLFACSSIAKNCWPSFISGLGGKEGRSGEAKKKDQLSFIKEICGLKMEDDSQPKKSPKIAALQTGQEERDDYKRLGGRF